MRQSFQYKLMRAGRQKHLHRLVKVAAHIWNHSIALHKTYYRLYRKHLPRARLQSHLAKLKRTRFPHWAELNSQAVQQIADRIEAGYQLWFDALRRGRKGVRPPAFRKAAKFRSFTLKQTGWKLLGPGRLLVQDQVYRFHQSREIQGEVKTVTLKRDPLGAFWVIFSCDQVPEPKPIATTGKSAGFDFGLKTFLTGNDGTRIENPQFLKSALRKLRKANRAVSRKHKGSRSRHRAVQHLARVHRRVANLRDHWHWQEANRLVTQHDELVFETLNLDGMKRLWGRKVSDYGFAAFLGKVSWLAQKHGRHFSQCDRFEPTSKGCSCCQHIQPLTLDVRRWTCVQCGSVHDRDQNAAVNILEAGRGLWRESAVRPAPQAALVINAESHGL